MKQIFIYALTFAVIVLPTVFFTILADKQVKKNSQEKTQSEGLFRIIRPFTEILMMAGVGNLFRKAFPGKCSELQKQLNFAGLKITAAEVFCMKIFLLVISAVAVGCVTAGVVDEENRISIPVAALIAAMIGWCIPGIGIDNMVKERRIAILKAIPYSIDLIASAMRGGLDFSAAVRFYVKLGIDSPLTDEYSQMLREMELGVVRTVALQNMADRIQIREFTSFAAAIAMGTELGAPLTETMEIQGEEMRKARFAMAECKAQRAPSLMLLPMALFILPAVFIIILTPVFLKMREAGVPLF